MSDEPNRKPEAKVAGIVDREVLERIRRQRGEEEDRDQVPLSFRLIRRLFGFIMDFVSAK